MSGISIKHGSREGLIRTRNASIQLNNTGYNRPKQVAQYNKVMQGSRIRTPSSSSSSYNRSTDLRQTMSQMDHTNLRKLLPFR